jgi:ribosome maturation factor RimP
LEKEIYNNLIQVLHREQFMNEKQNCNEKEVFKKDTFKNKYTLNNNKSTGGSLKIEQLKDTLFAESKRIFPINGINLVSLIVTPRKLIQITIMKKGGITIDDCQYISKIFQPLIPEDYDFQVQSPGIGFEIRPDTKDIELLTLFEQQPVKIFYYEEDRDNAEVNDNNKKVFEASGTFSIVTDGLILKKFSNKKKNKDNEEIELLQVPFNRIIKIKTTFFSEEI